MTARTTRRSLLTPLVGLILGGLACSTPPPPPEPPPVTSAFSAERAWGLLEQLVAVGSRVPGSPGSEAARALIRGHLESLGLAVTDRSYEIQVEDEGASSGSLVHLTAIVPGEREDLIVLAAPYDTPQFDDFDYVGANDGGSGVAVLLELAQVLQNDPLPYTVWLVFLDGDAPAPGREPQDGLVGSRVLANEYLDEGILGHVRVFVYVNKVGDADLRVPPDLFSHRVYRSAFFRAAARNGDGESFPQDAPVERLVGGHLAFVGAGMRRGVGLIDPAFGGEESPGIYWHTEDDSLATCSAASLGRVGAALDYGLRDVAALFAKVDRFAGQRTSEEESEEADSGEPSEETDEVEASLDGEEAPLEVEEAPMEAQEPASEEPAPAENEEPAAEAPTELPVEEPGATEEASEGL